MKFRQKTRISHQIYLISRSWACYFTRQMVNRALEQINRTVQSLLPGLSWESLRGRRKVCERSGRGNSFWASFCMKISWLKGEGGGRRGFSISFWKVCPSQAEFIGFPGGYMEAFKVWIGPCLNHRFRDWSVIFYCPDYKLSYYRVAKGWGGIVAGKYLLEIPLLSLFCASL